MKNKALQGVWEAKSFRTCSEGLSVLLSPKPGPYHHIPVCHHSHTHTPRSLPLQTFTASTTCTPFIPTAFSPASCPSHWWAHTLASLPPALLAAPGNRGWSAHVCGWPQSLHFIAVFKFMHLPLRHSLEPWLLAGSRSFISSSHCSLTEIIFYIQDVLK